MSALTLEDRFSIRGFHTFQWVVIKDINIRLGQTGQGRTQLSITLTTAVQTMNLQYMFKKEITVFFPMPVLVHCFIFFLKSEQKNKQ